MTRQSSFNLVVLLLLGITVASFAQIHIFGPQSGTLIDTTYIVDEDISVEQGDSLVIEAGANLLFNGPYKFEIQGLLTAIGAVEDSIIFKPNVGIDYWHGIDLLDASSDSCLFKYCLVEGSNGNGIAMVSCSPTIDHCTIRRNSNGGSWGAGLYITSSSSPVISNCVITENKGSNGCGISVAFCTLSALPVIKNCIIIGNYSSDEGAGINVEAWYSLAVIDHCLIAFNTSSRGGGIHLCSGANAIVRNCTIVGNISNTSEGGGICTSSPAESTEIENTIIAYNTGGGTCLRTQDPQMSMVYNCLYNNQSGNFTGTAHGSLGIMAMVNANGDSCDIYHNILKNPLFVDTHHKNFHLHALSSCIDAGDPNSPRDPDSTIADIGAYYFYQTMADNMVGQEVHPAEYQMLSCYPNPFNATTVITFDLPSESRVQLAVFNILGQHVVTLFESTQQSGEHNVTWDASEVPSGIYFARLQTDGSTKTIQMILLK